MRGLFYYRTHREDPGNQGVVQKCKAYAQAFRAQGIAADEIWYTDKGLIFNEILLFKPKGGSRKKSFGHLLLYYALGDRRLARTVNFQDYDFFLIRHMPTHPEFLTLLKKAKRQNPDLKIIIELPTWPYDAEMKGGIAWFASGIDRLFRSQLSRFTDRFLHYGSDPAIWGVPTILVQNGVAVGSIPKPGRSISKEDRFCMVFIGSLRFWHGIDRLLLGLYAFKQQKKDAGKKIELKIVGIGAQSEAVRDLADQLGLSAEIQMLPPCSGEELHALMEEADLGIGTLGMHRKGVALDSSLKHRAYCAYGLPFIFAGNDPDFPETYPFCKRIPADETPVPVAEIWEFVEALRQIHPDAEQDIRVYAETQLDWEAKIKPVINYLV